MFLMQYSTEISCRCRIAMSKNKTSFDWIPSLASTRKQIESTQGSLEHCRPDDPSVEAVEALHFSVEAQSSPASLHFDISAL